MQFGRFDDEHCEYVITRPDTPLPWINYLGSENFYGLISNTFCGYSFYRDARLRRLTRFRYNNPPLDMGARFIYLRDAADGYYWSPTGQPVRAPLDEYTCRHGMGYTTIQSTCRGVKAEIRAFIPIGDALEIWQVRVTNLRAQPAGVSLFAGVEFCLWDALDDASNFQRNFSIGEVEVDPGVIYHKTEYRERRDHFAYFACSAPTAGFDTQREAFLGQSRGWDAPRAVEQGACGGSIAFGWAPIGVHQLDWTLAPGEERQVIFLLGYHENPAEAKFDPAGSQRLNRSSVRPMIDRYCQASEVESAFAQLNAYWSGLLGALQVQTPDSHTNRMVNTWNAYQCMVTFNMSRSASFFESGIGRGMGFRDSNQDLLGFVHMVPARARQRILDLAATQLPDGGAYHQYQPLTRKGNNQVGSGFNDDPLWLILGVTAYIKETGDWEILQELAPFDSQPGTEAPLYQHLQRSLHYTMDRLGPHGLPQIGRADWNDCLNLNTFSEQPGESFQTAAHREGKTAESMFIAALFVLAARELIPLADHQGDAAEADFAAQAIEQMCAAVDRAGWDGEWFLRAYDYFGNKVGSRECPEGQIFIEPQGIAVMAGLGVADGRAARALQSVAERLATPHGIVLQQPAFTHYSLNLGEISSYPPGYKENAGIFCHTNPWIMIAEAILGHGDQAFDYYTRINPSARETISDIHRCEPYVYAQMIAGRDAPTHGEAKNSWLSGTAAWNYVAITQWILGIRPELEGLRIDPALPCAWPGFHAVRFFRGVKFEIDVQRGAAQEAGLYVDGKKMDGKVVPLPAEGVKTVQVQLVIGE